jgi:hypothetical protein
MVAKRHQVEWSGNAAIATVGAMVGLTFAGSTLATPLYVIYEKTFGFPSSFLR